MSVIAQNTALDDPHKSPDMELRKLAVVSTFVEDSSHIWCDFWYILARELGVDQSLAGRRDTFREMTTLVGGNLTADSPALLPA